MITLTAAKGKGGYMANKPEANLQAKPRDRCMHPKNLFKYVENVMLTKYRPLR